MYIELIDLLRCPRVHEESWLVAAFNKMDGRFVIEGKLGCPVCSASFPIVNGVADLRDSLDASAGAVSTQGEGDEDTALRVAAMLGLTRAGSVAVLSGMPGPIAGLVAEMASVRVVGVNRILPDASEQENVAMIRAGNRLPFASGSIDAVMLGATASIDEVEDAVRILKTGGRLVVTADSPLRGNLREIARDDHYIVAESTGPLLGLKR